MSTQSPIARLERMRVMNVGSVAEASVDFGDLTVFVGTNGSGKSCLVHALALPGRIQTEGLPAVIHESGGFESHYRKGAKDPLGVDLQFRIGGRFASYSMQLQDAGSGVELVGESVGWDGGSGISRSDVKGLSPQTSVLSALPDESLEVVRDAVRRSQYYWGNYEALNEPAPPDPSIPMNVCSSNWASVARRVLKGSLAPEFRTALQNLTGDLVDVRITNQANLELAEVFRVSILGKAQHPKTKERGNWLGMNQVSTGTLKTLDLLVALLQDAGLIVFGFEEPELHVHPAMVAMLVDYFREATMRHQVVLTTHSPDVLRRVHPHELRLVTKVDGATVVSSIEPRQARLVEDQLYGLDEVFRMEGLRPAPAIRTA